MGNIKKLTIPNILENLEITATAAEGVSIAKWNDVVVFVPYAIVGDIVDIRVVGRKRRYIDGRIERIITPSKDRIDPRCEHFGICGGCKWQHKPYSIQLAEKEAQVRDQLTRIGKIDLPLISPIIGSEDIYEYRNKLEYTFSSKRWLSYQEIADTTKDITDNNALGFHIPGMFDKVLDIKSCHLQDNISNKIRLFVKDYALKNRLSFYDIRSHEGDLRNLIIRNSSLGELMVIFCFAYIKEPKMLSLLEALKLEFKEITSLMYVINTKKNDTISDLDIKLYNGTPYIKERLSNLTMTISPKAFYQTNSKQTEVLYSKAVELLNPNKEDIIYDLYTGTGTIANFMAHTCKKVVGVEYVEEAIKDAYINSTNNNISNTTFYAGDMKDILNDTFFKENGYPDKIVVDPPRSGMHGDVVETLLKSGAKVIIYISCNPATQARDIELLSLKYKVTALQPVDMFPHTHHVENIAKLELL